MAEEKDYERIGRLLYGMQRACYGEEGLQALRDDPLTPPAVAALAQQVAERYRTLLGRIEADAASLTTADVDGMMAEVQKLVAARRQA